MSRGRLLPGPLVDALLRAVHDKPETPGDAELLFDEFGRVGREHVLPAAFRSVLGDSGRWWVRFDQLEAALIEMRRHGELEAVRVRDDDELVALVMEA